MADPLWAGAYADLEGRDDWWAFTFRQPWGGAVILGKTPENRTRPFRQYPRRVWVHAGYSYRPTTADYEDYTTRAAHAGQDWTVTTIVLRGALLGTVVITGCHPAGACRGTCTVWAQPGGWHWELADPAPLPVPFQHRAGHRGFWQIPAADQPRLIAHVNRLKEQDRP